MSLNFEPALGDLQDALPAWWAHRDPGSELAKILQAVAENQDALATALEAIASDQTLATASDAALRTQWAVLYGAKDESLAAMSTDQLRAYLQARAAEDGTTRNLIQTLLAILRNPLNTTGTVLIFPADGTGLAFPADGSALGPLFQSSADMATTTELDFPADGSPLVFPADGTGLAFPNSPGRLEIFERLSVSRIDVYVRSFLAFDRGAFARAVARARPAHFFPSTVTETSNPQTS